MSGWAGGVLRLAALEVDGLDGAGEVSWFGVWEGIGSGTSVDTEGTGREDAMTDDEPCEAAAGPSESIAGADDNGASLLDASLTAASAASGIRGGALTAL